MANTKDNTDSVGYCKPPRKSQFKKGTSGNPGGRPKGSGSFAAAVRKYGDMLAPIEVDGKPATMWDVMGRTLIYKAAKGDLRAMMLAQQVADFYGGTETELPPREIEVTLQLDEKPPASYCAECGKALDDFIENERREFNLTKH